MTVAGNGDSEQDRIRAAVASYEEMRKAAYQEVTLLVEQGSPAEQDPGKQDARHLGDYFDRCGAWHEYLLRTIAETGAEVKAVTKQRNVVASYLTSNVYASAATKDKSDLVNTNADYLAFDTTLTYLTTKLELLEAHADAMSRRLGRISRHITLRQGQQPMVDRRSNVLGSALGGYGPMPPRQRTHE